MTAAAMRGPSGRRRRWARRWNSWPAQPAPGRPRQAAIVHDWPNMWALEGSSGPRNLGLGYWRELACHYNALARAGVTVDFIGQGSDLAGTAWWWRRCSTCCGKILPKSSAALPRRGGTVVVSQ